jgi:quercetin dioxygenase-like cupin family protein
MIKPLVTRGLKVPKGWGEELIFANDELYCGKLLVFRKGAKSSMHYHLVKDETWYVAAGEFIHRWVDTEIGQDHEQHLRPGDVVRHVSGQPHQVEALTDGTIFEVSSQHFDTDSYRIQKGDSQTKTGSRAASDS